MAELYFAFGGQRSAEVMLAIAEASEGVEYYDDQRLVARRIVICRPLTMWAGRATPMMTPSRFSIKIRVVSERRRRRDDTAKRAKTELGMGH